MSDSERCRRYRQRRKAGVPTGEVKDGFDRFQEALQATLPPVRPAPPAWFRGKTPLEIVLGRKTYYA